MCMYAWSLCISSAPVPHPGQRIVYASAAGAKRGRNAIAN